MTGSSAMGARAARESDRPDYRADPAVWHLPSHLRFWIVICGLLGLDLWSKRWAFTALAPDEIRPIIDGTIDFRRSLNDGAVFGSFTGYTTVFIVASLLALGFVLYLFAHSTRGQRSLHIALGLILAGALGNLYDRAFVQVDVVKYRTATGEEQSHLGMILSDPGDPVIRLGTWPEGANPRSFSPSEVTVSRQGVVRDFIKFVPKFPVWVPRLAGREVWPWVFNVADAALVCGVVLLLLHTWLDRKPHRRRE